MFMSRSKILQYIFFSLDSGIEDMLWTEKYQPQNSSELIGNELAIKKLLKALSSVQSLSRVQLFATPWTTAERASLSITNSRSPPKPMSIESVMPSNHLILCRPLLLLPSILPRDFPMSQLFASDGQSIGASALTSVLSMNTQDRSPLEWTGWISLQSKGLSRVFSNTTVQKASLHGKYMWKQWLTLFFWAPESLQMVIAAVKLKDAYSLEGKLWPT